jgi:hypothetical protein
VRQLRIFALTKFSNIAHRNPASRRQKTAGHAKLHGNLVLDILPTFCSLPSGIVNSCVKVCYICFRLAGLFRYALLEITYRNWSNSFLETQLTQRTTIPQWLGRGDRDILQWKPSCNTMSTDYTGLFPFFSILGNCSIGSIDGAICPLTILK